MTIRSAVAASDQRTLHEGSAAFALGVPGRSMLVRPQRMPRLAGLTELALATGKSKQYIYQVLTTQHGAPKPVARTSAGPIFVEKDALDFIETRQPIKAREWPDEWRLVGRAEIATILGERAGKHVSGAYAAAVMARPRAPKPVASLKLGRIWREDQTRAYLDEPRPAGRVGYEIDIGRARELYEVQGLTINQAASQLGVPRDVLRERLTAAGVRLRTADIRRPPRRVSEQERAEILVALQQPGATPNSVAAQFKRSPMTVQRYQEEASSAQ